jgi:hypothetical protein
LAANDNTGPAGQPGSDENSTCVGKQRDLALALRVPSGVAGIVTGFLAVAQIFTHRYAGIKSQIVIIWIAFLHGFAL